MKLQNSEIKLKMANITIHQLQAQLMLQSESSTV